MNTAINQLPVRTWNWLGVNNAGENAALFVPQNSKASVVFGPLPAGVQQVQAPAQGVPQSGMGREVDEFVLQHANTTCFVAVEGKAETPLLVEGFLDDDHPQLIAHILLLGNLSLFSSRMLASSNSTFCLFSDTILSTKNISSAR